MRTDHGHALTAGACRHTHLEHGLQVADHGQGRPIPGSSRNALPGLLEDAPILLHQHAHQPLHMPMLAPVLLPESCAHTHTHTHIHTHTHTHGAHVHVRPCTALHTQAAHLALGAVWHGGRHAQPPPGAAAWQEGSLVWHATKAHAQPPARPSCSPQTPTPAPRRHSLLLALPSCMPQTFTPPSAPPACPLQAAVLLNVTQSKQRGTQAHIRSTEHWSTRGQVKSLDARPLSLPNAA